MDKLIDFIDVIAWVILIVCICRMLYAPYFLYQHNKTAHYYVAQKQVEDKVGDIIWKSLCVAILCIVWIVV